MIRRSPGAYFEEGFCRIIVERLLLLMCTCYVFREETVLIGMNFDNDGKDFKIVLKDESQFIIMVNVNGRYFPSFGINSNGTFINELMVDSTGEGKYKRQNQNRWVTTSLIEKVLSEDISFDKLNDLLKEKTIVNCPNSSTHCMAVDKCGNVCVVEPGRKNIFSSSSESPFYIMTNFPLSDYDQINPDEVKGSGAVRYKSVHHILSKFKNRFDIDAGFEVLEKAKQDGEGWITEFSMISIPKERTIFFTLNGDFKNVLNSLLLTEK